MIKLIKNVEISNAEESTQIALQVNENIESFEIDKSTKKKYSISS
jgi:hypothetical protein